MTWRVFVEDSILHRGRRLFVARDRGDGRLDVLAPLTFTTIDAGLAAPDAPVLDIQDSEGFLRAMLNAAWDAGLRPDGFMDTRESMKATTAHLEDMRALAFHKIGAMKP